MSDTSCTESYLERLLERIEEIRRREWDATPEELEYLIEEENKWSKEYDMVAHALAEERRKNEKKVY